MALPPRVFYTLTEAAARWGCSPSDIVGWASIGTIEIVTGLAPSYLGGRQIAGLVTVAAADILPMFRRCGSGPDACEVRRVRELGAEEWSFASPTDCGPKVAKADLMIMADEVERFEEECALFRRVDRGGGGTGPAAKYDWDGFYLRLIVMIHDNGLPETQSDLVGQMQEWFIEKATDGDVPDESTIRRRVSPIWRALQGRT